MRPFVIAQITGIIAVIFSLLMYQFNSRRTMLILDIFGGIFWIFTFIELHAPTGAIIVAIGVTANLAFILLNPTRRTSGFYY